MSRFQYALKVVLGNEGGYSDINEDRGGATNYGVTQRTYDDFCALTGRHSKPVRGITMEEVELIYGQYWKDAHCSYIPEPLDILVFDSAINHGARKAVKLLQQVLGVDVDGVAGRGTMQALHEEMISGDINEMCSLYLEYRQMYYNQIIANDSRQEMFRQGWENRLDHLRELVEREE